MHHARLVCAEELRDDVAGNGENETGDLQTTGPLWLSIGAKPGRFYVAPICKP